MVGPFKSEREKQAPTSSLKKNKEKDEGKDRYFCVGKGCSLKTGSKKKEGCFRSQAHLWQKRGEVGGMDLLHPQIPKEAMASGAGWSYSPWDLGK